MKGIPLDEQAVIFDNWRRKYPSMSYEQQCRFYDKLYDYIDDEDQFNYHAVSTAIKQIRIPVSVLEIGGWKGQLAKEILTSRLPILYWYNKEICSKAVANSVCQDERYKANVPHDWFWKIKYVGSNFIVMSHVLEHILFAQFEEFVKNTAKDVPYIYIDAPIEESGTGITWNSFAGSHILEVGWKQVEDLLGSFGFIKILKFASARFFARNGGKK